MGTLLWQLNDCWPVTSWSIIDYYKEPKASWFAVKEAFDDNIPLRDSVYPKNLVLKKPAFRLIKNKMGFTITSNVFAKYVYISSDKPIALSENYFDLKPGEKKIIVSDRDIRQVQLKVTSFFDARPE